MTNNRTGVAWSKHSYRALCIRFRTRAITCQASRIYANRDLFELIFQPASSSKNPRYKRTDTDLWRPNSGGGGGEATDTLHKFEIIMPSVTFGDAFQQWQTLKQKRKKAPSPSRHGWMSRKAGGWRVGYGQKCAIGRHLATCRSCVRRCSQGSLRRTATKGFPGLRRAIYSGFRLPETFAVATKCR